MSGPRSLAAAAVVTVAALLLPAVASAQEVDGAATDLEDHDVTFEDGALSSTDLDQLDAMTARLQDGEGYFKVVVLEQDIGREYRDARTYAEEVQRALGGRGSVIVFAPDEVGVGSNVDSGAVGRAEDAAVSKLNQDASYASASRAAAQALGITLSGSSDGNGGGFPWFWLLVIVALPLVLLWVMWRAARKMQRQTAAASAEEIGKAEAKVRGAVDKVANDLLELADPVDRPDASAEAKAAFSQGAQLFTTTQEQLDQADTRPELETAYEQVMTASWQLDTARALLAGQAAPAKPEIDDLFPRPTWTGSPGPAAGTPTPQQPGSPLPQLPVPAPEPHYQKPDLSPWITAAAMAAMSMLSQRGMRQPQTRPPMDDGMFGNWASGLPSSPSSANRGSTGGRGFGRRRGSAVTSSGERRERGMGRR